MNGYCLGALVLAFAGFFSARLFDPGARGESRASGVAGLAREGAVDRIARLGRRLVALRRLHRGRAQLRLECEFAALLVFAAATTLLAMVVAARVAWPRLNWLGVTLWPLGRLVRGDRAARRRASRRRFRLARVAGRRAPRCCGSCAGAKRCSRASRARCTSSRTGSSSRSSAWEAHWLVDRATGGIWPEAAVLALGAAARARDVACGDGRRLAVRRERAHLRAGRLRRRARGAGRRDSRAERRIGRRSRAAAVSAARESARARERARVVRVARVAARARPADSGARGRRARTCRRSPPARRGSSSR